MPLPVILSGDKEIFWLKETEISSFGLPQETLNLDSLQIYGDDSAHDKIYAAMLRSTHPLVNLTFDLDNRIVNSLLSIYKAKGMPTESSFCQKTANGMESTDGLQARNILRKLRRATEI